MTAQKRLTDEFKSNTDPEMTVKFTDIDGNEMEVEYYSYDTNYYAAVINKKVYLVNKMTVKELFQAFESVTGEKEENEKLRQQILKQMLLQIMLKQKRQRLQRMLKSSK